MPRSSDGRFSTNGQHLHDPLVLNTMRQMVQNITSMRSGALEKLLDPRRNIDDECGFPQSEQGADQNLLEQMDILYRREPVARRVVNVWGKASWKASPLIYETENPDEVTEFERAWDELGSSLSGKSWHRQEEGSSIWEYLERADIQSGRGHFGILLMGFDDGKQLWEPVDGVMKPAPNGRDGPMTSNEERGLRTLKGINQDELAAIDGMVANKVNYREGAEPDSTPRGTEAQYWDTYGQSEEMNDKPTKKKDIKLIFLRVFDETLVQIVRYENNLFNPRFGQPIMYRVTLNDPREQHQGVGLPMTTVFVHWSRVIHVAEVDGSSEFLATPKMEPVVNNILNLRKVYHGDGEAYWKSVFMHIFLQTHAQLGGDVEVNDESLRDMMEQMMNSGQRWGSLKGMEANAIAPSLTDPTAHVLVQLEAICIYLECPMAVFRGSEKGELAGADQDDDDWNDRVRKRNNGYVTPRIIVPFIDRLILVGCLPEPTYDAEGEVAEAVANGYKVFSESNRRYLIMNAEDKADVGEIHKGGYCVDWPQPDALSAMDKASIAGTLTTALAAYVAGNVEALLEPMSYLTKVLGWDEEEVEAYLEEAAKAQEEKLADQQALADEHDLEVDPQIPGLKQPEPKPPFSPVKVKEGEKLVDPESVRNQSSDDDEITDNAEIRSIFAEEEQDAMDYLTEASRR